MTPGTLTIRQESGVEIRELFEAKMAVHWMPSEAETREFDCEISLYFSARHAAATEPDGTSAVSPIDGEIRIKVDEFVEERLVGATFSIPKGYDRANGEHLTHFFYKDHLELDQVHVGFLGLNEGRYHIEITAACEIDTYDGSGPMSEVQIDGWFDWSSEE